MACSSIETEYKSLANATAKLIWIHSLLQELGLYLSRPPMLWCDNLSAIYLTENLVFHTRMKYIKIDYHFVCEHVTRRQLMIRFISSIALLANVLTKGLSTS